MVTLLIQTKDPFPQPTFSLFCSQPFHVYGLDPAMSTFSLALAGVLYISPLIVNGAWWLKSLTVILYQTLMLKQLCLVKFETRHVASASVSNRFGVSSFPILSKQTLLFANAISFHLTPVGDLKMKRSPFILHSFCICTTSSSLKKKNPLLSTKWPAFLLQVLTLQKMIPPPQVVTWVISISIMHHHPVLNPFSVLLPSLFQSFPFLLKKFNHGKEMKKKKGRTLKSFDWRLKRMLRMKPTTPSWGLLQCAREGTELSKQALTEAY